MATVEIAQEQQLLIGGSWTAAKGGGTYEKANPFTGETATVSRGRGPRGRPRGGRGRRRGVQGVGHAARRRCGARSCSRRPTCWRSARRTIAADRDRGDRRHVRLGHVQLLSSRPAMLREAGAQAYGLVGEVIPSDVPGKLAMGVRAPAGVVVAIAPWNAPVILSARSVATPLAYANTVVLKASEECPRTHAAVVKRARGRRAARRRDQPDHQRPGRRRRRRGRADRPPRHPAHQLHRARRRSAGSSPRRPAATSSACCSSWAARRPILVLKDADLDRAVAAANFGAFFHQGQICMSTERAIVDSSLADAFAQKLADKAGVAQARRPARARHGARPDDQRRRASSAWTDWCRTPRRRAPRS